MSALEFFNAARAHKREITGNPLDGLTQADVDALNGVIRQWKRPTDPLTPRAAMTLIGHEAIVQEAYKDSVGVWTWGIGVTSRSGHNVERYKDNPQPIRKCLEIFIWLLREKYIPAVLKAFGELTEAQFAAALSFHYNTGAIATADWVESFRAGQTDKARSEIMKWRKPPEIVGRRTKERDLFFDGAWESNPLATVYPVKKPSYTPDWRHAQKVDVMPILKELLA